MLKTMLPLVAAAMLALPTHAQDVANPAAETHPDTAFVAEPEMQADLLRMLARFTTYMQRGFIAGAGTNARGEQYGCFRSNSTMRSNEDGVRPNADLGMVAAFLCRYAKGRVELPEGVTWTALERMAMESLVYAYSTHKAVGLATCADGGRWGSTSAGDHQWESSLWAMSVAYSAFFQWDRLTPDQRGSIETLLKAECNYELERDIPTGYEGDTKAEENGWEADVLAATLGLFPHDALAPRWFDRLRRFAINTYAHRSDAADTTVVDPHYDRATVASLHEGQNLYDDYTLQNHNYFHTSYQNVVIQELGEAALALRFFQQGLHGAERWRTNALTHHCLTVQHEVLDWLALADGELAMPNGNDWSLFLYDQLTSYSTNATLLGDADALMLENRAYQMIKARQRTTPDGSWLLRSDIGARRMGVEAHRVMMTWLMHHDRPTAALQPSTFADFRRRHAEARHWVSQNIVRAYTPQRFTTFSWAKGLGSYTGYIAPTTAAMNNIVVPYKAHNTGNFLGWYTLEGRRTNARAVADSRRLDGMAWTVDGELLTNDDALRHRFALYSTPGNAVVYLDRVTALKDAVVTREQGGLMAISTDEFTRTRRVLAYESRSDTVVTAVETDGSTPLVMASPWVNIDQTLGIVSLGGGQMAFADRADNNSVMTTKLYASFGDARREVRAGGVVGSRIHLYYSNVSSATTRRMAREAVGLREKLPEGWNGVLAPDPDGMHYLLLANFGGAPRATLAGVATAYGAPVFCATTTIRDSRATASFAAEENQSVSQPVRFFVRGRRATASAQGDTLRIDAPGPCTVTVMTPGHKAGELRLKRARHLTVRAAGGRIIVEE